VERIGSSRESKFIGETARPREGDLEENRRLKFEEIGTDEENQKKSLQTTNRRCNQIDIPAAFIVKKTSNVGSS